MPTKQKYTRLFILLLIIALIFVAGYLLIDKDTAQKDVYTFNCENNKSIIATFYPTKDTKVDLALSDGRKISLPHAISASGARYANADEKIVFWNKGTTAFITEGTSTTYTNCDTQNNLEQEATTTKITKITKPVVKPRTDGLFGYANSEYNFTLRFPSNVNPQNYFTTFYNLASNWRLNAGQANQGKAIVSFPVYRIDQGGVAKGKAYPLFFVSELRVGVSPNVKECYATDIGYTNQKVTDVKINGVTFKKFSFQDAAMMKYIQGESYRTIHNNMCYVLEQIKSGSNYKDETMKPGLTEAELNKYYNTAGNIVGTFRFTK
ncbi:MAG: MliC family protein [Candidatus Nomurabacteria bacterium]